MTDFLAGSIENTAGSQPRPGGKKRMLLQMSLPLMLGLYSLNVQAQSVIVDALENVAETPPQSSVAGVIGVVCPERIATPDLQRDCNALVGATLRQDPNASTALGQVTPDQAATPVNSSLNSLQLQTRNVAARLAALRIGATGLSTGGLGLNVDGRWFSARDLASLYQQGGRSGGAASADEAGFSRLGVFVNGSINTGTKDATINEAGFDFNTGGVTAGVDYRINDQFILGGAFGYSSVETDLNANGGGLDADSYSLIFYGTYYQDQFYVDGSLSYGWNNYDQSRNVRYTLNNGNTTVDQSLSASYDGDQFNITFGGGYDFNSGGWTFGPVAQLQYIKANVDGYRESASSPESLGSGWTVQIGDQDYKSFTLSLGGQVSYALSQSWGVLLPQARFEWIHEFENDSPFVTGHFLGDPSQESFSFAGDEPDTDYFNLGIGVSAVFAKGRSAFFNYQKVLGYNDLTQNSFNLGIRLEF